jgi:hypothetical protein
MGLYIGLGFAGDLAGDFWVADPAVLGEAARRACVRDGFGFDSPRAPFATLSRVPLFGRVGGGVCETSSSESEESTTGCLRAALGLPMPPRAD